MKLNCKIFRILTLAVALIAAGQNAWAQFTYTSTLDITWTLSDSGKSSTLRIAGGGIVYESHPEPPFSQSFDYTMPIVSSPYNLTFSGSLTYDVSGESSARTDGDFILRVFPVKSRIKKVSLNINNRYNNYWLDCEPNINDKTVVEFLIPGDTPLHIKTIKVEYYPSAELSDFNQLSDGSYAISSASDLKKLALLVNGQNNCSGLTFRQTFNISFMNTENEIIGTSEEYSFQGTYDGKGYTISKISNSQSADYLGIFGYVKNGTIQNVMLSESRFYGHNHVGGIVGYNKGGTINGCTVSNTVISTQEENALAYGGIVGTNDGGILIGNLNDSSIGPGTNSVSFQQAGGIVGNNIGGTLRDCLFSGSSVTGDEYVGSIAGKDTEGTYTNNYYTSANAGGVNGSDIDGARRGLKVALGAHVKLVGDETLYRSKLTAIGSGNYVLRYNNTFYSGVGQTLTFGHNLSDEYTVTFSADAGTLTGNTLVMPDGPVKVSAIIAWHFTMRPGAIAGETYYWATLYDEYNYLLPTGAIAYTMGEDHHLYRVGTDGRIIPKNTAVVILADPLALTTITAENGVLLLTRTDSTASINGTNILKGSTSDISTDNFSKKPFMLGVVNGVLGFHFYYNAKIPAHKAYYVH